VQTSTVCCASPWQDMSGKVIKSDLYTRHKAGETRRTRVRLEPGTYDRTKEGYVVLHAPVEVERIEVLRSTHSRLDTVTWITERYDWDTAVSVPEVTPDPSWLERLIDWFLGRRQLALPPAKVVDRRTRR
jgi:hypothetical protein